MPGGLESVELGYCHALHLALCDKLQTTPVSVLQNDTLTLRSFSCRCTAALLLVDFSALANIGPVQVAYNEITTFLRGAGGFQSAGTATADAGPARRRGAVARHMPPDRAPDAVVEVGLTACPILCFCSGFIHAWKAVSMELGSMEEAKCILAKTRALPRTRRLPGYFAQSIH